MSKRRSGADDEDEQLPALIEGTLRLFEGPKVSRIEFHCEDASARAACQFCYVQTSNRLIFELGGKGGTMTACRPCLRLMGESAS